MVKPRVGRLSNSVSDAVVYLDYAATTPVDPEVAKLMTRYLGLDGTFGNASSRTHCFGWEAREAVEKGREQVAELLNADPVEIVWTSGATESINLAIKGVALGNAGRGRHVVTSSLEHKASLDSCSELALQGFEISYVDPDQEGLITPKRVEATLRTDTTLVSLMHVNNEVGTVTDVQAIGEITRSRGIAFHIDAAQSASRLPLDAHLMGADLISLSGHKIYGPKGVGALYVRRSPRVRIAPQIHGGGHEQGLRSGTLATHQIVGMGMAAQMMVDRREQDAELFSALDRRLLEHMATIDRAFVNGNELYRVPGIMNVAFECVDSESLMMALKDVAISSGSACTSSRVESSHVLLSLGLSEELASCSVRFSLGRFSTQEEIDFAAKAVGESVYALRRISPQWELLSRGGNGR